MVEITVGICESFRVIGIDISQEDLRKFEQALYVRGLNVAPRNNPKPRSFDDYNGTNAYPDEN